MNFYDNVLNLDMPTRKIGSELNDGAKKIRKKPMTKTTLWTFSDI